MTLCASRIHFGDAVGAMLGTLSFDDLKRIALRAIGMSFDDANRLSAWRHGCGIEPRDCITQQSPDQALPNYITAVLSTSER
jgi:hypothetical protein